MIFLEFLAVGTWSFWLILGIAAVIMSQLLDTDHPGYAAALAAALVAVLAIFGDFNPLMWIKNHTLEVVEYLVGYFVVGTVWGVAKWFFWLQKIRRFMDEFRLANPTFSQTDFRDAMRRRALPTELPPKVGQHKTMIVGWMALWPSSMIWTLLHDPVKWVFEEIYASLGGMMQKIANHVFKDFK